MTERPALTRLLISCDDRPGIVSAVSGFLFDAGANIVRSDQYTTDPEGGHFFMRMEFFLPPPRRARGPRAGLHEQGGRRFAMDWRMCDATQPQARGMLVSREEHCLLDLMWRWRRGALEGDIALVASNHEDPRADVEGFGIPFHHVPVTKETKPEAEERLLGCSRATASWWCSRATCRSCPGTSSSGSARR